MIKAKKSLGQNFLIDNNVIEKIINITQIKNKNILEVGPGTGNLTSAILKKKPKKVIVVEKDFELVSLLKKNFKEEIEIINNDILKINENEIINDPLIVFGNLPYNISTEILIKWILNIKNERVWFDYLVLMFQKEVADRITANVNSKNYGRLSILTSWRMNVKKIADVSPNSFFPIPKVKSTILLIEPKIKHYNLKNPKNLEYITSVFFNQRRKMIKKPLNLIFNKSKEVSKKLNINVNDRPQNLDPSKYFEICKEYEKLIF